MLVFVTPDWYSSDGRRLLRRGRGFQLIGLALLGLTSLLG